jgi:alpha-mannosidase
VQLIKEIFNKVPRAGWQIDPFGHSAVQAYQLGAEVICFMSDDLLMEKYDVGLQDNPSLFDYNVEQRVNDFINAAINQVNS